MGLWRIACWLDFSEIIYDVNIILYAKYLVLHLHHEFHAHLLHPWRYVVILSLQFVDETIRPVVNGRLVPFIHWYYSSKSRFAVFLLVHWRCDEAVMIVLSMVPALLLWTTVIMAVKIPRIRRRKGTVRLSIWLFIVKYVPQGLGDSTNTVFCCGSSSSNFFLWPTTVLFVTFQFWSMSTISQAFNLAIKRVGHWYRKGREVNRASRPVRGDVWLSQGFVNCLFHLIWMTGLW